MDTNKKETYFIDIDGTILKYRKFNNYYNKEAEVIPSTLKFIEEKFNEGHMIVLTTARPESMLPHTVKELLNNMSKNITEDIYKSMAGRLVLKKQTKAFRVLSFEAHSN